MTSPRARGTKSTCKAVDSGCTVCGARLPTAWWLESSARQRGECDRVRAHVSTRRMWKNSATPGRRDVASRFCACSTATARPSALPCSASGVQRGCGPGTLPASLVNAFGGQQPRYPPRSRLAARGHGLVGHLGRGQRRKPSAASSAPVGRCQASASSRVVRSRGSMPTQHRPRRRIPWIDANAASGRVVHASRGSMPRLQPPAASSRHHLRCRSRPRRRGAPSVRDARAPRPCPSAV